MLIPAALGLIISTLFLNFFPFAKSVVFVSQQNNLLSSSQVLGASEEKRWDNFFNQKNINPLSQSVARVLSDAKSLPLPRIKQLPEIAEPIRKLPANEEKVSGNKISLELKTEDFTAQNGVILDCDNDDLSFARRPDRPWPIASITKLFTVYTFLDYNPGWEQIYEIKAEDRREGGKIYLFTGDKVTVKDLFYFSLVGSDNTATAALVAATGLSEEKFVEKMNDKIKESGLKNTRLVEPVGLKDGNISTAREVAMFAKIALAKDEIKKASLTKKYEFFTKQGRKKSITNTDDLLNIYPDQGVEILGGKTGYINSSGYCLVGSFKNNQGKSIITVILGADSDNGRFSLTKKLVDLFYKNKP